MADALVHFHQKVNLDPDLIMRLCYQQIGSVVFTILDLPEKMWNVFIEFINSRNSTHSITLKHRTQLQQTIMSFLF